MIVRLFVYLLFLVSCSARGADIGDPVEKILANEEFSPHAIQISSGILDSDALYHLAIVVDSRGVVFLYFFRETPDGTAEILDHVEVGSTNARPIWSSEIKKKSVFISVHSSGGCCSHGGMTYQLKLNDEKQLVIIGYEAMNQGSNDGKVFYEDNLSFNLITGDVITSHSESEKTELWSKNTNFKPSWRMFKLLPPIKEKSRQFHAQINKQWRLQNVSSYDEEFSGWVYSTIYGLKK